MKMRLLFMNFRVFAFGHKVHFGGRAGGFLTYRLQFAVACSKSVWKLDLNSHSGTRRIAATFLCIKPNCVCVFAAEVVDTLLLGRRAARHHARYAKRLVAICCPPLRLRFVGHRKRAVRSTGLKKAD